VFYQKTHRYISTESEYVLEQCLLIFDTSFINVYENIDCVKNYNGVTYFNVIKYT